MSLRVRPLRAGPPDARALVAGLALIAASLPALDARADAIMPLREPCPAPNVKGIRGHAEACLAPPPDDCPPGWRGAAGGQCWLHECSEDSDCGGKGLRCADAPTCFESKPDPRCVPRPGPVSVGERSWLGAPLPYCEPGRPPYEEATHPCGDDASSCAGTCKPHKLCLAPGAKPSVTRPGERPDLAPKRGGCAGCDVGGASGHEATLALALLVSGLGALRGRRRPGQR